MERNKPYKLGTIITLKDGNIYRTSRLATFSCYDCVDFYGGSDNCPCARKVFVKSAFASPYTNRAACRQLYGEFMYPKLIKK